MRTDNFAEEYDPNLYEPVETIQSGQRALARPQFDEFDPNIYELVPSSARPLARPEPVIQQEPYQPEVPVQPPTMTQAAIPESTARGTKPVEAGEPSFVLESGKAVGRGAVFGLPETMAGALERTAFAEETAGVKGKDPRAEIPFVPSAPITGFLAGTIAGKIRELATPDRPVFGESYQNLAGVLEDYEPVLEVGKETTETMKDVAGAIRRTAEERKKGKLGEVLEPHKAFEKGAGLETFVKYPGTTLGVIAGEQLSNLLLSVAGYWTGGIVGASLTSMGLEGSDLHKEGMDFLAKKYGTIEKVPVQELAKLRDVADEVSVVNGSLDVLPIVGMFSKFGLKAQLEKNLVKTLLSKEGLKVLAKEVGKDLGSEITTENAQEYMTMAGMETIMQQPIPIRERLERHFQATVGAAGTMGPVSTLTTASQIKGELKGIKPIEEPKDTSQEFLSAVEKELAAEPPVLDMTDRPFETAEQATRASQQRGLEGYTAQPVEGGYGLRRPDTTPVDILKTTIPVEQLTPEQRDSEIAARMKVEALPVEEIDVLGLPEVEGIVSEEIPVSEQEEMGIRQRPFPFGMPEPTFERPGEVEPEQPAPTTEGISVEEITPEQIDIPAYRKGVAKVRAEQLSKKTGEPYAAVPHPTEPERFMVEKKHAKREQKAAQLYGNVPIPEGPQKGEGQMPAQEGGKGILEGRQRQKVPEVTPNETVRKYKDRAESARERSESARRRVIARTTIDQSNDSIVAAVAKLGGLNSGNLGGDLDEGLIYRIVTKNGKQSKRPALLEGTILPIVKKNGGKTVDGMTEILAQYGYPVRNDAGMPDANKLLDLLNNEVRGTKTYSDQRSNESIEAEYEASLSDHYGEYQDWEKENSDVINAIDITDIPTDTATETEVEIRRLFTLAAAIDQSAAEASLDTSQDDTAVIKQLQEIVRNGEKPSIKTAGIHGEAKAKRGMAPTTKETKESIGEPTVVTPQEVSAKPLTKGFARIQAAKLTKSTGTLHGIEPHPTEEGKFVVVPARIQEVPPDETVRKFSRRLYGQDKAHPRAHDFVVPETPEFAGNDTGDLAYSPRSAEANGIEQLPIRLTVGEVHGEHRGFGMLHIAKEGDIDARRKSPAVTDDEAENYARHVAMLAKTFDEIYMEDKRVIFRSQRANEAIVTQRRIDEETGKNYYSAVSVVPSRTAVWGNPVWRAGRTLLPTDRRLKPGAPDLSPGRVSQQPDRQMLGEIQTEHFDLSKERAKKQVPITYKKRKVFTVKEAKESFGKAAVGIPRESAISHYSRSSVREDLDLIVQHNVTAENIMHAHRLGGFPVPSLAITRSNESMTNFGEITLIGDAAMADPKGYAKTQVFGADVYSPRYPKVTYKFDSKKLDAMSEKFKKFSDATKESELWHLVEDIRDEGAKAFENSAQVMAAFLNEKGIKYPVVRESGAINAWRTRSKIRDLINSRRLMPEFSEYADNLFRTLGADERIFTGFTYSGNRRYITHTLDNVVRILKKELRGGEGFNYGVGSLRAHFTPRFRSISQIRKEKGRIVSKENFEKIKEEIAAEFFKVVASLSPLSSRGKEFGFADTVIAVMEDSPKMGVTKALSEYGITNASDETKQEIAEFLVKLRNLPTEYFEAKILRAVDLSEFRGAVVPENTSKQVLDVLKSRGVQVAIYKKGDKVDRRLVVKTLSDKLGENVLFSHSTGTTGTTAPNDRKLLTAQKVGIPKETAISHLSDIVGDRATTALIDAGVIRLVDNESQIPEGGALLSFTFPKEIESAPETKDTEAEKAAREALKEWPEEAVQGENKYSVGGQILGKTMPDGTIYLNLGALSDATFRGVALHEGFHATIQSIIGGQDYSRLMKRMENIRKLGKGGKVGKFFQDAIASIPANTPETSVNEEIAGYAIERYTNAQTTLPQTIRKWVTDFLAAIRIGLMRLLPKDSKARGWILDRASEADLARMAVVGLRVVSPEVAGGVQGQPLFSRRPELGSQIQGSRLVLPAETAVQKKRRQLQDEAIRWKVVQKAVVDQGGVVNEENNVAKAIERYPGILAAAVESFGRHTIEPLLKRIVAVDSTIGEIALLLYAEHAEETNREIAKINRLFPNDGTPGKSGSGMTDMDAKDIIAQVNAQSNAKELFAIAKEFRSITDERLDILVMSGAMDKNQADAYREKYKRYVPLKGFENANESGVSQGTGQGLSTGKRIDFRRLGRSSRAGDIVQNIIRDYEIALMSKEKREIGKVVRKLIEDNPDDTLWTISSPPKKPLFVKGQNTYQVKYFGTIVSEFLHPKDALDHVNLLRSNYGVKKSDVELVKNRLHPDGLVIAREIPFDDDEEIRYLEKGKEIRIQITDPLLVRSYNRLWGANVSEALKVFELYNGVLRQFYTQKNPAWFVLNVFKDVQASFIYNTGEKGFSFALKTSRNIPKAFNAAWAYHHNKSAGKEMDRVISLYRENGGYTGFSYIGDIESQTNKLNGLIARYSTMPEIVGHFKGGNIKRGMHDLGVRAMNSRFIAWIEALNTTFENMTRLATFNAAIDSGMSPKEAALLAKNTTTNFNTRGEWGPNINALWLFANANIQGNRNVAHALFVSEHKAQVWALMGGFVALGIMAGLLSNQDDDLIDDSVRSRSLTFKFGNAQVTLPMSWGYGFFAGLGQYIAQAIKHPEKRTKLAVMMADLTASHFSPFGNPFGGGLKAENIVNLAPTFPKPFLQMATNVSTFGGPLYPESPFDISKPDSEKAWRGTRGSGYDVVAKWINMVSGGSSAEEGLVSVSPEILKLSVSTMFGGVGRLITDLFSIPFDATNDEVKSKNIPISKSFYRKIDADSYLQRFYQQAEEARKAFQTYKAYQKAGKPDNAKIYEAEHKAYISVGRVMKTYQERLKIIRDNEDRIKMNKDISNNEKNKQLRKLDDERIDIAKKFNKKLRSF